MKHIGSGLHLLSFGAGDSAYNQALHRISNMADKSGFFDSITSHNRKSMDELYPEFKSLHDNFVEKNPLGYGRWVWKPFLINQRLKELPDDSILLYLDVGCWINFGPESARKRMSEYILHTQQNDILAFQHNGSWIIEKAFTRVDLVEEIDLSLTDLLSRQINAGVIFFKVNEKSRSFVKEWLQFCTKNSYAYLMDPPPELRFPEYIDHRHDQSVFSGLIKKHGILPFSEETWFLDWEREGEAFPIWQKRDRPARSA